MVYDRLNSAVDGLALGNGTVYNFINYIGRIHLTGGIARYTLNRGYFFNNISSNFEGGLQGRYGYGNGFYGNEEAKSVMESTIGLHVKDGEVFKSTTTRDKVGDFYRISGPLGNSEIPFTSIDDFSLLGEYSREGNLSDNVYDWTFAWRHRIDGNDWKFSPMADHPILPKVERGDEVVNVWANDNNQILFGNRSPIRDSAITRRTREFLNQYTDEVTESQGITEEEKNTYYNLEKVSEGNIFLGEDFTWKRNGKKHLSLLLKGESERNDTYLKLHSLFRNIPVERSKDRSELFEKYGDFYIKNDGINEIITSRQIATSLFKQNEGLFDYYAVEREDITGENEYAYGHSYAMPTDDEPEKYDIDVTPKKQVTIVDKWFKRGSFRTNSADRKSTTYTYYEENDQGAPVTEFKDNSNVPQGVVPKIDSFGNSSRIMRKMNEKFRSNEIKSLVNRFHTDAQDLDPEDQLVTAYTQFGLSRGRNLLRKEFENTTSGDKSTGFDNPYCRVWTAHYQYSKMKDRIRPFMVGPNFMSIKELQEGLGRLRPNGGAQRLNDNSVLMDNGFVKITPFNRDGVLEGGKESLKKYMFSIENLAWKGFANEDRLSDEQIGPYGGRIMWFPPYNLKFTENVNTNWQQHEFIGRGEKIYTYVNTERAGTLDFSILIDHPSILNKSVTMGETNTTDEDILRFFAGCGTLDTVDDGDWGNDNQEVPDNDEPDTTPKQMPDNQFIKVSYIIFYPNNFSAKKYYNNMPELIKKLDAYEMEDSAGYFIEMDDEWSEQKLKPMNYDNKSKFGLNAGGWSNEVKEKIQAILPINNIEDYRSYADLKNLPYEFSEKGLDGSTTIFGHDTRDYEIDSVVVQGFASDHGYAEANNILANNRAETIKRLSKFLCDAIDNDKFKKGDCLVVPTNDDAGNEDVNGLEAKIGRSAIITFNIKMRSDVRPSIEDPTNEIELNPSEGEAAHEDDITNEVVVVNENFNKDKDGNYAYTYQNEYMYFKNIESTNPLIHKQIVDKVRFFDPAFHSLTPEGFNARLNFLQQCTRQGPTIGSHSGGENQDKSNMSKQAGNMSFGMAPYCILRVGDFYYTKIVIDSISINYDNDGKIQWDLNPEGVGVQPMMANVNISFKFIGGQDIEGPVQQLQNALSYNYYANSSIYTPETQAPMPEIINKEKVSE